MKVPFHQVYQHKKTLESCFTSIYEQIDTPGRLRNDAKNKLKKLWNIAFLHLTTSCTHSLETIALALNLQVGDEVIVPSFSYVTSANAFALRGAKIVFADIHADTMNIDLVHAKSLITEKTKALVVMHYAGVACDMDLAKNLCLKQNLFLIEDAAHTIGATYKNQPLGTIGHAGAWSFHHTKNIQCGEGGALYIQNKKLNDIIESVVEKGTNRHEFLNGKIDYYDWVRLGSSYSMSDMNAAHLIAELEYLDVITKRRKTIWLQYHSGLISLEKAGVHLPPLSSIEESNGHIFFIKCINADDRSALIDYLEAAGIQAYFHYPPLHLSPGGKKFGVTPKPCPVVERESQRLLRLPIYPDMTEDQLGYVIEKINQYYGSI